MAVLHAKLHNQGGPRRRPALAQARQGRRIYSYGSTPGPKHSPKTSERSRPQKLWSCGGAGTRIFFDLKRQMAAQKEKVLFF